MPNLFHNYPAPSVFQKSAKVNHKFIPKKPRYSVQVNAHNSGTGENAESLSNKQLRYSKPWYYICILAFFFRGHILTIFKYFQISYPQVLWNLKSKSNYKYTRKHQQIARHWCCWTQTCPCNMITQRIKSQTQYCFWHLQKGNWSEWWLKRPTECVA